MRPLPLALAKSCKGGDVSVLDPGPSPSLGCPFYLFILARTQIKNFTLRICLPRNPALAKILQRWGRVCPQPSPISRILDFSRRVTIVFKRPSCELVHQEWLTTARGHTVASCDERGLACAAHTDVVYIHICGHVSAGSGHEFRIFPRPNNRCCSGANGRLPSRHWHPSQQ